MTGTQQQPEPQPDVHADFRQDLKVVIAVVKKLALHCKDIDDLIELCEFGLKNDGQVAILLDLVAPVQMRK